MTTWFVLRLNRQSCRDALNRAAFARMGGVHTQPQNLSARWRGTGIPIAQHNAVPTISQIMVGWLVGVAVNQGAGLGGVQPVTGRLEVDIGVGHSAAFAGFALRAKRARNCLTLGERFGQKFLL